MLPAEFVICNNTVELRLSPVAIIVAWLFLLLPLSAGCTLHPGVGSCQSRAVGRLSMHCGRTEVRGVGSNFAHELWYGYVHIDVT